MQSDKSRLDRAKQFMPFDALKGFKEALQEKEQEQDQRVELIDEQERYIDRVIRNLKLGDNIEITYYYQNKYIEEKMTIKKLSFKNQKIVLNDKTIFLKDIRDISIY